VHTQILRGRKAVDCWACESSQWVRQTATQHAWMHGCIGWVAGDSESACGDPSTLDDPPKAKRALHLALASLHHFFRLAGHANLKA